MVEFVTLKFEALSGDHTLPLPSINCPPPQCTRMPVNAVPACVTVKDSPPMVRCPVRAAVPGFAVTEKLTVALAFPDDPPVTLSQFVESDVADQLQPAVVRIFTVPPPAPAPTETESAESEKLHTAPASVIVKVCPAMVNVPLKPLTPRFALTEYDTVPLPLPLAPPVICVQPTLLAAPQLQPDGAKTFTLPVPPAAPKDALEGEME